MTNYEKQGPLKLGFIGGSNTSAVGNTHKIAAQMDSRWVLSAGCFSTNPERNHATAAQWNLPAEHLYDDWQTLLDSEREHLDAVAILTPTPNHKDMVIAALAKGYPVICEKALACTVADVEEITSVLDQHKGFLAVTYNYSGYPMLRELKHRIAAGELGAITQVQIEMPQEGFIRLDAQGNPPVPQAWRLVDGKVPMVSLDLGSHVHHIVGFLTGETPHTVVADQGSFGWFKHIADSVMCMVRYSNDMQCQMWYGKTALGHRNGLSVRVYGDKASAEWIQSHPEELYIARQNGDKLVVDRASNVGVAHELRYNRFKAGHPAGFMEAFANLYWDMADALEGYLASGDSSSPYVYGVAHAKQGMALLEAIESSQRLREWVDIQAHAEV